MSAKKRLRAGRIIVVAAAAALVLRSFVVDAHIVRGRSMEPAISPDSLVLVLRCAYGLPRALLPGYLVAWSEPRPGDVVVSDAALAGGSRTVKRVFETGPAFVRVENGELVGRGGRAVLSDAQKVRLAHGLYIPAGHVYLVGDNRMESWDSRDYGPVPIEKVRGRVVLCPLGCP
ncbi:MAG: signal peptidase I [Spirochaetales bacterium]|nr:signal peptidase I [Spirochaetales bacterium]MBP7263383.1 signal peptidase I [Spirochaetia bacterium]